MLFHNRCPRLSRLSSVRDMSVIRPNTSQLPFQHRFMTITSIRRVSPSNTTRISIRFTNKARLPTRQVRFQSATVDTTTSSTSTSSSITPLTWNKFLALRKSRRRMNLTMSIVCSATSFATGAYVIAQDDLENKLSQAIGLDPIITMGLVLIGCGGLGWLVGPFFGTALFQSRYRSLRPLIEAKEKEFFLRIKKYRVDPTSGSYSNPVPDYYGEKIGSVRDYRRWLKDQRAFNLKRGKIL